MIEIILFHFLIDLSMMKEIDIIFIKDYDNEDMEDEIQ